MCVAVITYTVIRSAASLNYNAIISVVAKIVASMLLSPAVHALVCDEKCESDVDIDVNMLNDTAFAKDVANAIVNARSTSAAAAIHLVIQHCAVRVLGLYGIKASLDDVSNLTTAPQYVSRGEWRVAV